MIFCKEKKEAEHGQQKLQFQSNNNRIDTKTLPGCRKGYTARRFLKSDDESQA